MNIVSVDPDTAAPGVAVFFGSTLRIAWATHLHAALRSVDQWLSNGDYRLVIECPQTYGGRAAGGSDANVLIQLARVVGMFEQVAYARGRGVRVVTPFEWKRNVPKGIAIQRAWDSLSESERAVVSISGVTRKKFARGEGVKSGEAADVMDAVGIGLWATKR